MYLSSITSSGSIPALISTLSYNESRLKMLADNVANIGTPGYRAKQLDTKAFQHALREALDAQESDPEKPFHVEVDREVQTDRFGRLVVEPTVAPPENILFHDGTNMSIERQMSQLAETGMMHETAATLLQDSFEELRKAIRGTVG